MPKIAEQQKDKRARQTARLFFPGVMASDIVWPKWSEVADHVEAGGALLRLDWADPIGIKVAYPKHLDVETIRQMSEGEPWAIGVVLVGWEQVVHGKLQCEPF